jgi:hypothetical protein
MLATTVREERQRDDDADDDRVDDGDGRERCREEASLAVEAALPEEQERLADLFRVRIDVLAVGPGRLIEREPRQGNWQEHQDVADPVREGDGGWRVAALTSNGVKVRQVLGIEGAPEVDVRPAEPALLGAQGAGEVAQAFGAARVDRLERRGQAVDLISEVARRRRPWPGARQRSCAVLTGIRVQWFCREFALFAGEGPVALASA